MTTENQNTSSDVRPAVIIGSGPAGYTAAIYLARAGFRPLVLAGELTPGGQLVNTTTVENFPGFPDGILGPDLMDKMRDQAEKFGAEIEYLDVTSVDFDSSPKTVTCSDGTTIAANAVIITTGSQYRKLGVPGEQEYSGHGVSYCATCDGFFFRNQPIVVVGGGDSALEEALFLTRFGSSVTVIHRRDTFRASQIMVDRAKSNPKINLLMNSVVTEIHGSGATSETTTSDTAAGDSPKPALSLSLSAPAAGLSVGNIAAGAAAEEQSATSVSVRNTVTGEVTEVPANGIFIAIGHEPATAFLGDAVAKDAQGYIIVEGAGTVTSAPGVFAAGDCVDHVYRQAISAAGMGCRAALDAQAYLASLQ
ncbi:NAD(P)/FAD-dependent oxidoreductase [Bifidobacterium leontopitheci]|uniref:Thioredoxin reductase n=1 Tax=Bifidobacterium leontopitheci TaxID=2650774 RepID=A0A6I1GD96_9BIFI|nr:thioredoxin-disulfide reductase [Bifidobacterium leontopitheci]KAB7788702.1 thioredoxin reductase [Bifidobacterium leontopitheci]